MRRLFCKLFHGANDLMHPFRATVVCRKCQCIWPVRWEVGA